MVLQGDQLANQPMDRAVWKLLYTSIVLNSVIDRD